MQIVRGARKDLSGQDFKVPSGAGQCILQHVKIYGFVDIDSASLLNPIHISDVTIAGNRDDFGQWEPFANLANEIDGIPIRQAKVAYRKPKVR